MLFNKASDKIIQMDLEKISEYNSTPGEGITRILFTEPELQAREYIRRRMRETGLDIEEDAIGNIFGVLRGTDSELSPVWTGSHIDTVLNAGQFDGMVGVVGGLEALRLIKESGMPHERDIKVVVFTSEEPTRFGKGCLGSRALAGDLQLEDTEKLFDKDGNSLRSVLENLGYDMQEFRKIKKKEGEVYAAIELHIEQGAVLENLGIKTGVVTAISAPTDIQVEVNGIQEHAGATPMYLRHDAMTTSAKLILAIEEFARTSDNPSTVATVGVVNVYPGATNVVPGKVNFSIDMRSSDFDEKNTIITKFKTFADALEKINGVKISTSMICNEKPAAADESIIKIIQMACENQGKEYNMMVSGAYHDSMFVSRFAPFGMIFVPSKNGISHHKDEWTDYADIARGVDILAESLYRLSCEVPK